MADTPTMFGPIYELRNKRYDMDSFWYWLEDHNKYLAAFFAGLEAGRIWERPVLERQR